MKSFVELFPTLEEQAVVKLACEKSLKVFIKTVHRFHSGASFVFKDFHNEIIKSLEDRANYKSTKNLIINIPVGFGKSIIVEYFIAWCFIRNKNNCFLYSSYSDKLIVKHSGEVKEILSGEVCSVLWGYQFQKDKQSKANWSILGAKGRSGLTAGAIGGTITGLDAGNPAIEGFCGAMIIDDAIKATDIIFETKRDDCVYKYDSALTTRLRRDDVPIIIIMQRLHEEDLCGFIKNEGKYSEGKTKEEIDKWKEKWDCITIKALVNEKSIWEEKVSTQTLIDKRNKSLWVFYPQYQQEVDISINSKFKGLNFATEEEEKLIENGIGHIDKGFGGDYTAFTIINKVEKEIEQIVDGKTIKKKIVKYYVFGKLWNKHVDDCEKEIDFYRIKYRCGLIRTENNDDKGAFAKNKKHIVSYHENQNKFFKIMSYAYPYWKDIYFLKDTDSNYIRQTQNYDENSKNDDAPDSLASAIKHIEHGNRTQLESGRPF